jgi:hypothetical protein
MDTTGVSKIKLIISTLFLALTFSVSASVMLDSGRALSAPLPMGAFDAAMHSCNDGSPIDDHGHHCHDAARRHTARSLKSRPKPVAQSVPIVWQMPWQPDLSVVELPLGWTSRPDLSGKTPFLTIFRIKTSLLF